jgi:hypothetical protein
MDVSFSAWRHSREESLQLKGDSFSFLFDRRYTNRLNRMSRVFFEAYVVATKELAAQEDRFPSLSEIDAKMESGAVYAFKDRLMKNTEFFEEVKISGVSYLVPRALRFVDVTGTYTDLTLSFEEGTVILPTRRKTPLPLEASTISQADKVTVKPSDVDDSESSFDVEDNGTQDGAEARLPSYPGHMPEAFEEISTVVVPAEDKTLAGAASSSSSISSNVQSSPVSYLPGEPLEKHSEAHVERPAEIHVERPSGKPAEKARVTYKYSPKLIGLLVAAAILAIAAGLFFSISPPGVPINIEYSAYLDNSSNESYLGLDIVNPHAVANDMEMALPPNIDKSISARGGVVTISHGENTLVKMNSSGDASVKIYLLGNWTKIPVGLSFSAPEGFESSLQVHGQDYYVTRKNETLVLMFNLTGEGVSFEQSYTKNS